MLTLILTSNKGVIRISMFLNYVLDIRHNVLIFCGILQIQINNNINLGKFKDRIQNISNNNYNKWLQQQFIITQFYSLNIGPSL